MDISRTNVKRLIDEHLHGFLVEEAFTITSVKAVKLLTPNRFDIAFKLFYLDIIGKEETIARKLYKSHIDAFSLGEFTEPGNFEKNSIEKYYQEFSKICKGMRAQGFSIEKSLIPVSKDTTILNGSHRIASAIVENLPVKVIELAAKSDNYSYDFFYKRGMSSLHLDIAATKFIEYADNVYVAIIWPSAVLNNENISNLFPNIVYQKKCQIE